MLSAVVLLILVAGVLMFKQNEYVIEIEHMDVIEFDERYLSHMTIQNFRHNRTTPRTVNVTVGFKTDYGTDVRIEITSYRFASNEYREFPMAFSVDLCDVVRRNEFGVENFYACGNFSKCPLKKGVYTACNWSPDYEKFPPNIPAGKYMLEFQFKLHSAKLCRVEAYWTFNYLSKH